MKWIRVSLLVLLGACGPGAKTDPGGDEGARGSAPQVDAFVPEVDALDVAPSASVHVAFSKPMDTAATTAAFVLIEPAETAGSVTWTHGDRVLVFTPETPFPSGSRVRWMISTKARDAEGNRLASAQMGQFTVGAPPQDGTDNVETVRIRTKIAGCFSQFWANYNGPLGPKPGSFPPCWVVGDGTRLGQDPAVPRYRAFLGFSLDSLSGKAQRIVASQLEVRGRMTGEPYNTIGPLTAAPGNFLGPLSPAHYYWPVGPSVVFNAEKPDSIVRVADVTSAVKERWENREATEYVVIHFRLAFEGPVSPGNSITLDQDADLVVSYEVSNETPP